MTRAPIHHGPASTLTLPRRGRTSAEAIHDHPTLSSLLRSWQQAQQAMTLVRPVLGDALASQLRAGPWDGGHWVLLADHGQAAAKVRQMLPLLTARLAAEGLGEVTVKVKVSPRSP
jgi:hypothetical protein